MNKYIFMIVISLFNFGSDTQVCDNSDNFVPDEATAIKIAVAIWEPIYGKNIYQTKPFKAKLTNNKTWIVEGTLRRKREGGVPYIEIRKSDCKIIKVTHGK